MNSSHTKKNYQYLLTILHIYNVCNVRVFINNCSSRRIVESNRRIFRKSFAHFSWGGGGLGACYPRKGSIFKPSESHFVLSDSKF